MRQGCRKAALALFLWWLLGLPQQPQRAASAAIRRPLRCRAASVARVAEGGVPAPSLPCFGEARAALRPGPSAGSSWPWLTCGQGQAARVLVQSARAVPADLARSAPQARRPQKITSKNLV